jgi:hypothetical protein
MNPFAVNVIGLLIPGAVTCTVTFIKPIPVGVAVIFSMSPTSRDAIVPESLYNDFWIRPRLSTLIVQWMFSRSASPSFPMLTHREKDKPRLI